MNEGIAWIRACAERGVTGHGSTLNVPGVGAAGWNMWTAGSQICQPGMLQVPVLVLNTTEDDLEVSGVLLFVCESWSIHECECRCA